MHGNGYISRELPCIWSHITLKLGISAHSKPIATLECGNHYNVSFITLHAKTESPVHVQPLVCLYLLIWVGTALLTILFHMQSVWFTNMDLIMMNKMALMGVFVSSKMSQNHCVGIPGRVHMKSPRIKVNVKKGNLYAWIWRRKNMPTGQKSTFNFFLPYWVLAKTSLINKK